MFIDIGSFIVDDRQKTSDTVVKKVINTNYVLSLHQHRVPPTKVNGVTKTRAKTAYFILLHSDRQSYQISKEGFNFLYKILTGEENDNANRKSTPKRKRPRV